MRWLVFVIFAYLMLGVQVGAAQQLAIAGGVPNFVLLAVVFLCLNAARGPATGASLALGVLQDLLTAQPPGLHGLAYGLIALIFGQTSRDVYPDHPLTHAAFALAGQIVVSAVLLLHGLLRPPEGLTHLPAWPLAAGSLYTAALAPLLLGVLGKIKGLFAFQPKRKRPRPY